MIRKYSLGIFLVGATAMQVYGASILYYVDGNNGTDEMAAALATLLGDTVTVATSPTDFATKITSGTYQLGIFSAQETYGSAYSAALAALATFVAGGGLAIVDSWFTSMPGDISPFGADFTGDTNGTSIILTAFNSGVANPVSITNPVPPYAVFSTGFTLDATTGTSIAATFSGTIGGEAAIVTGNGGRSIVNGFLNDTAGAAGEQIYINEINQLLSATPEPASWGLLGLGLVTLLGYSRFRTRKGI